jgi:hypothetical protein
MEEVFEGKNLMKACWRVVRNNRAAGVFEISVDELKPYVTGNVAHFNR